MSTIHFEIIDADDSDHTVLVRFWSDLIGQEMLCNDFSEDGSPKMRLFKDGVYRIAGTRLDFNLCVPPDIPLIVNHAGLRAFIEQYAPRQFLEIKEAALAGTLQPATDAIGTVSSFQQQVTRELQFRLDAWARSRGYDGILSVCTYATSSVPQFAAEGQRAVDLRDATWAKGYEILAAVEAGDRPIPTMAEILAEMPTLSWPE